MKLTLVLVHAQYFFVLNSLIHSNWQKLSVHILLTLFGNQGKMFDTKEKLIFKKIEGWQAYLTQYIVCACTWFTYGSQLLTNVRSWWHATLSVMSNSGYMLHNDCYYISKCTAWHQGTGQNAAKRCKDMWVHKCMLTVVLVWMHYTMQFKVSLSTGTIKLRNNGQ